MQDSPPIIMHEAEEAWKCPFPERERNAIETT